MTGIDARAEAARAAERSFLFVVGSSRVGGNTEALARLAAEQLPVESQHWLCLRDLDLPPFRDTEDRDEPVREPAGVERQLLDATLAATDLVIVTPLYWYSMSWPVKLYLDYWASWERLPHANFKDMMRAKTLWAVSVMADDDLSVADALVKALELSASYLGATFKGALLGTGSWPGDVLTDAGAVERARSYFD